MIWLSKIWKNVVLVAMILCFGTISMASEKQSDQEDMVKQEKDDLLAGEFKAICYSGFRSGQHPDRGEGANNPTKEQIFEDLNILLEGPGFKLLRLYDSGENSKSVLEVIDDNRLDIKVLLGIWLQAELSNHESCAWLTKPIPQTELDQNKRENASEIQRGIELANKYPDIVTAVNVGNEALVDWNDHKVATDTVIAYVQQVKEFISQPVTVAENYEWWAAKGQKLASVCDFVSIHIYPVWEGRDIEEGITYSIENVKKVKNALPNSRIVITEAGWASIASEFGERASESKQKSYYEWIMGWSNKMNITTFFFEAFDEDWKGDPNNPMGAEKHWGLYTVNRVPKKVMKQ